MNGKCEQMSLMLLQGCELAQMLSWVNVANVKAVVEWEGHLLYS